MPRSKAFPTPATITSSLSYLQTSFSELRSIIYRPEKGKKENSFVAQHGLYGLHIGITVLLTNLGIDRTRFVENGLRTGIDAMADFGGDGIDEKDEIESVARLLEMVEKFVDSGNPDKNKTADRAGDQGEADAAPVKSVSVPETQRQNEQTGVTHRHIANSCEITAPAGDGKTSVGDKRSTVDNEISNAVKGTVHKGAPIVAADNDDILVQTESGAMTGDKDSSTEDDNDELPVISGDTHPRAVDEIEPAEDSDPAEYLIGFTESAPVMIDLETHELAIDPEFAHLAVVDNSLPAIASGDSINPQQAFASAASNVGEESKALELEDIREGASFVDDVNMIQDGIGPAEVINEMLGDIGEMLDDNNSLCGREENTLLSQDCLLPEEDGERRHVDGEETDYDSERTISCCIAGSLVDGQESVYRPIFTDVSEEDKIWVFSAETSSSPTLLITIDDEKREEGG